MDQIIIENKNGGRQRITEEAFKLGKLHEHGWVIVSGSKSAAKPSMPPPTGQAPAQTVSNLAEKKADQNSDNNGNQSVENTAGSNSDADADHTDFQNKASELSKSVLKDFLDEKEEPYQNSDNKTTLVNLVGKVLNWDLEALKNNFNIEA